MLISLISRLPKLVPSPKSPSSSNILTSKQDSLNKIISEHENIDGVWLFSESDNERKKVINYSVSNLKRYWCPKAKNVDWLNNEEIFLNEFLYESTQIKNIWIPYGE